jgi:hypothetical protein
MWVSRVFDCRGFFHWTPRAVPGQVAVQFLALLNMPRFFVADLLLAVVSATGFRIL